ncbi:MAG: class I SAM-dependent methyltransferase [Anaerolineae bacterium]
MDAITQWQRVLQDYRRDRGEDDVAFWERNAGWYARSEAIAQRAGLWWSRLEPWARGASVLEIGPGPGVFTIPLAGVAAQVLAVEPSPAMASFLKERLVCGDTCPVEIVTQTIEDYLAANNRSFDLVVASHSLYNIEAIDAVMQQLLERAPRLAILMALDYVYHWRLPIEQHLRRGRRSPAPSARQFLPLLWEMGVYPDITVRVARHADSFASVEALLDWVVPYLQLSSEQRGAVAELLQPSLIWQGSRVTLREESRELLIAIERGIHTCAKE